MNVATRKDGKDTEADGSVRYRVVWFDKDWNEINRVDGSSAGETMAYLVNFLNGKRKANTQPDLYVPSVEKNSAGITVEVQQRG